MVVDEAIKNQDSREVNESYVSNIWGVHLVKEGTYPGLLVAPSLHKSICQFCREGTTEAALSSFGGPIACSPKCLLQVYLP